MSEEMKIVPWQEQKPEEFLQELSKNQVELQKFLETATFQDLTTPEFKEFYNRFFMLAEQAKQIKDCLNEALKQALIKEYPETGTRTIETENYKVTYVPSSLRVSFDSSKFKEDHPDLFKAYSKMSEVQPSVKITSKKGS